MGKIGFLFAGQGAQAVGMGRELFECSPAARAVFETAGERVKGLAFEGPAQELNATINAQPCLYAMDLACGLALNERGVFADGAAGFSLGEIPAVVHGGLMSLEDGLDFVNVRARAMDACAQVSKGGMFAVMKLAAEEVAEVCKPLAGAFPVNYNCPGQTVAACSEDSAGDFIKAVAERGGKAVRLAVSGPFHSSFMDEAAKAVTGYLEERRLGALRMPIYANATAQPYGDAKELLSRQVNSPVLWQKTIERMAADGFDTFIELGAGKTLSGFVKKINGGLVALNVCDEASLEHTVKVVNGGNDA